MFALRKKNFDDNPGRDAAVNDRLNRLAERAHAVQVARAELAAKAQSHDTHNVETAPHANISGANPVSMPAPEAPVADHTPAVDAAPAPATVSLAEAEDLEVRAAMLAQERDLMAQVMAVADSSVTGPAPQAAAPAPAADTAHKPHPRRRAADQLATLAPNAEATGADTSTNLPAVANAAPVTAAKPRAKRISPVVQDLQERVQLTLMERIDAEKALTLVRDDLIRQITDLVAEIVDEMGVVLNGSELDQLVDVLVDEMIGLGPLEPLLADEAITDIMVNGCNRVYVERGGKLERTNVSFRDDEQLMQIATRIATAIGRRIDRSQPLVDARLVDGSRVNIIIPPLAIDGPSISIRKFSQHTITLDQMASQGNISPAMAVVLKIAARSRLNILISGGTGSGKTTLLNAMSQLIDNDERIVTIEDAAELKLQQDHTVRLETRPANLEGQGEITMQDLVKNALRMRPDRIILGETRGGEAIDMLQAMNTGHDGSLSTIHANRPREALTRLENMVAMAGLNLPSRAVRTQITEAIDLIVQVQRMRDGVRRVTSILEIVGMEGDIITAQELFKFEYDGDDESGRITGNFVASGLQPKFLEKARYFGLDRALQDAMGV